MGAKVDEHSEMFFPCIQAANLYRKVSTSSGAKSPGPRRKEATGNPKMVLSQGTIATEPSPNRGRGLRNQAGNPFESKP